MTLFVPPFLQMMKLRPREEGQEPGPRAPSYQHMPLLRGPQALGQEVRAEVEESSPWI